MTLASFISQFGCIGQDYTLCVCPVACDECLSALPSYISGLTKSSFSHLPLLLRCSQVLHVYTLECTSDVLYISVLFPWSPDLLASLLTLSSGGAK